MPELQEHMYCSQQICIPPAFPYLLRQFCKSAIRTQPSDLLRWATAYWRCLALNIPPPVKPRLEYPLPQCRIGLTPGWLKALLYQLQGAISVQFIVLWDRWIGACLDHDALIEVLVLGGFTDPYNIPWFQFVGICAGYLCENLTKTMILVCEILTEEPDGGSAMIPLEIFLNIYTFLAALDAGKPQTLKNMYFTDDLLELMKKSKIKAAKVLKTPSTVTEEEPEIVEEEEEAVAEEEAVQKIDLTKEVSCPDIVSDEFKPEEDDTVEALEKAQREEQDKAEGFYMPGQEPEEPLEEEAEEEALGEEESMKEEGEEEEQAPEEESALYLEEETKGEEEEEETVRERGSQESVPTVTGPDSIPMRQRDIAAAEAEAYRLRALQELEEGEEEYGEDKEREWEELAKLKRHLEGEEMEEKLEKSVVEEEPCKSIVSEEEEIPEEEEKVFQDIYIDRVPGIGPVVPCDIVNAVVEYMKKMAEKQHGMVMPRNIRHFTCPPLEVLET